MTAIDAYQRDHEVVLAADRIASYDPEHHEVTVSDRSERAIGLLGNGAVGEPLSPRTIG